MTEKRRRDLQRQMRIREEQKGIPIEELRTIIKERSKQELKKPEG